MGKHWLMQWLAAWWHQAITWTNIVLSSKVFCGIHLRATLQEHVMTLIHNMCLAIIVLTHRPLGDLKEIWVIFKLILMIGGWGIFCKFALRWMSMDLTDDKSTLVQVMAWCRQATSHYLSQCWPTSMSPYGVTWPQWVKITTTSPRAQWVKSNVVPMNNPQSGTES